MFQSASVHTYEVPDDQGTEGLEGALAAGVPTTAIDAYARWWQLETYLRQVVYTELRAKFGAGWINHLGDGAPSRAERDRANGYMASADADELLAYADASVLFSLIEKQWELFEPILLPRVRWGGLADELLTIRNRSAHCRRPHRDDVSRLEQTLRNLEPGARRFYRSYTNTSYLDPRGKDPLVRDWIGQRHPDASRLIDHCHEQYEVRFLLEYSLRPWAAQPKEDAISGSEGAFWRADWLLGPREVRAAELWGALSEDARALVVHLLFDGSTVAATFAAVDDRDQIAAVIGQIFDRLIECGRRIEGPRLEPEAIGRWRQNAEELPPKVQVQTALAMFDPYNPDLFSIFSA